MVQRDRLIVIGGLAAVVVIAWIYVLIGAGMGMSALDMTSPPVVAAASGEPGGATAMSALRPKWPTPAPRPSSSRARTIEPTLPEP